MVVIQQSKWTIAFLKVLDDMNAPDYYAFGFVLQWAAHNANAAKYSLHLLVVDCHAHKTLMRGLQQHKNA